MKLTNKWSRILFSVMPFAIIILVNFIKIPIKIGKQTLFYIPFFISILSIAIFIVIGLILVYSTIIFYHNLRHSSIKKTCSIWFGIFLCLLVVYLTILYLPFSIPYIGAYVVLINELNLDFLLPCGLGYYWALLIISKEKT